MMNPLRGDGVTTGGALSWGSGSRWVGGELAFSNVDILLWDKYKLRKNKTE